MANKKEMGLGKIIGLLVALFCVFWVVGWFGYHMYAETAIGPQLKGQRYINDMAVTAGNVFAGFVVVYVIVTKSWKD